MALIDLGYAQVQCASWKVKDNIYQMPLQILTGWTLGFSQLTVRKNQLSAKLFVATLTVSTDRQYSLVAIF